MLRPPTMVATPSTVKDLLCMRRFRRAKSASRPSQRRRRSGNGLNTRTSMQRCAFSAASRSSRPPVLLSSSSRRTFTPRSAARSSACSSRVPALSWFQM